MMTITKGTRATEESKARVAVAVASEMIIVAETTGRTIEGGNELTTRRIDIPSQSVGTMIASTDPTTAETKRTNRVSARSLDTDCRAGRLPFEFSLVN
jgi:hypothetical protein